MAEERAQRRLAAIVAVDLVGYSRMVQADEAGTIAALRTWRGVALEPFVAEHGGRIVKLMGDGALLEFSSAVNALECAVDLQRCTAESNDLLPADRALVLRIGVNLGDIVVEGDDIFGDGVNVAARLEAMAEPGGIYLSGKVFDEVSGKLELEFDNAPGGSAEKHGDTDPRLSAGKGRRRIRRESCSAHTSQDLHCSATLRKHERRSEPAVFLRWDHGGRDHGVAAVQKPFRHCPQLIISLATVRPTSNASGES